MDPPLSGGNFGNRMLNYGRLLIRFILLVGGETGSSPGERDIEETRKTWGCLRFEVEEKLLPLFFLYLEFSLNRDDYYFRLIEECAEKYIIPFKRRS